MPISGGKYVSPSWVNGTEPAIDATEMQAITDTLAEVPVANGGTGATTAAAARTNLGITPQNIGAMPTSGGTFTGAVTFNGAANFNNGAALQGDMELETATIGTANISSFGDSVVPVANGGTGATTVAGARNALGLGNTSGAVPIANGGTGATTVAAARNALGLGNTSGAVPLANGGTGANNAGTARINLGTPQITAHEMTPTSGVFTVNGNQIATLTMAGVLAGKELVNVFVVRSDISVMVTSINKQVTSGTASSYTLYFSGNIDSSTKIRVIAYEVLV